MKKIGHKALILWISVLCMLSCTRNPGLERTYQRAGENRAELEKVLRHYEGDGRKHRAALFLRDLTKGKVEQQFILDNDGERLFHL